MNRLYKSCVEVAYAFGVICAACMILFVVVASAFEVVKALEVLCQM